MEARRFACRASGAGRSFKGGEIGGGLGLGRGGLWLVGQAGEVGGESSYSELGSVIVWLRKGLGSGGEGLVFFMVEVLV